MCLLGWDFNRLCCFKHKLHYCVYEVVSFWNYYFHLIFYLFSSCVYSIIISSKIICIIISINNNVK